MSDDDWIREIEERWNKATQGPWEYDGVGIAQVYGTGRDGYDDVLTGDECCGTIHPVGRREDFDAIAASREDVSLLLAEVRRLRGESDAKPAQVRFCRHCLDRREHRWRPSPEAGPHWRCGACGEAWARRGWRTKGGEAREKNRASRG